MNIEQQAAKASFEAFMRDPEKTVFALFGAAGTGKSFTIATLTLPKETLYLSPTHKAARILAKFLRKNDVRFEMGYSKEHKAYNSVVATVASALGKSQVIVEKQNDKDTHFDVAPNAKAVQQVMRPRLTVIDEVSMVSQRDLKAVVDIARENGGKVLVVGDQHQLPPVKDKEIKWGNFVNVARLTKIMRQSSESVIPYIGLAINKGEAWRGLEGNGATNMFDLEGHYIDNVEKPSDEESERDIFISYKNVTVNAMNEACCRKLYGHGRRDIEEGELVIAQNALTILGLYRGDPPVVITNQTVLRINKARESKGRWGKVCTFITEDGVHGAAEFIDEESYADPENPWNKELKKLQDAANMLQNEYNKLFDGAEKKAKDSARRAAWVQYFAHKDRTVLSFSHPFAQTAHKAQGSTYRDAYIDSEELEKMAPRALYVAVTRASRHLYY